MTELGYDRFGVQGTDWGSIIGTEIALRHRSNVLGLHINMVLVRPPADPSAGVSEQETRELAREERWLAHEMGYDVVQSTKPEVLAPALNDSPAGLAAWIVDKFRSWTDCDGDVERRFSKDELLATATTYWVTNTITSSMRFYFEYSRMEPDSEPMVALRSPQPARCSRRSYTTRLSRGCKPAITSGAGPSCLQVGTSPPWKSQICSLKTSPVSSDLSQCRARSTHRPGQPAPRSLRSDSINCYAKQAIRQRARRCR